MLTARSRPVRSALEAKPSSRQELADLKLQREQERVRRGRWRARRAQDSMERGARDERLQPRRDGARLKARANELALQQQKRSIAGGLRSCGMEQMNVDLTYQSRGSGGPADRIDGGGNGSPVARA